MHPVPLRLGGFGGADGLAAFLRDGNIAAIIDATHPYAAQISANAVAAAAMTGVPLIRLERAPWRPAEGDRWLPVASVEQAMNALGQTPRRVFLALGRQQIAAFAAARQHFYLIRSVEPVEPPLDLPQAVHILGRGPFDEASELALLKEHGIDAIICKNSGGTATYSKLAAARRLEIPVLMLARPEIPAAACARNIEAAMAMLDHVPAPAKRGE